MALVERQSLTTKDGRSGCIRVPVEDDAPALLETMHAIFRDGTGMALTLDEMPKLGVEEERAFIRARRDGQDEIFLVAEVEGVLAGNVQLQCARHRRLSHAATLAISLIPGYRALGLGDALMHAALAWAIGHPRVEKVDLRVLSDNAPAIALYRKHGFVEEARLLRAIRHEERGDLDDVIMSRWL